MCNYRMIKSKKLFFCKKEDFKCYMLKIWTNELNLPTFAEIVEVDLFEFRFLREKVEKLREM